MHVRRAGIRVVHRKHSFTPVGPAGPGKGATATRQLRDPNARDEGDEDFDEDDSR
ncbi:hypothetical protein ACFV0L_43115 [Streptosporangium canum]|uniref:hypothetical protein n=1 Tax=Streptosporangium canum TaxID=324952 RepID=UPI0036CAD380